MARERRRQLDRERLESRTSGSRPPRRRRLLALEGRAEAQRALDAAGVEVGESMRVVLGDGVGVDRAAALLDLDASEVRRLLRTAPASLFATMLAQRGRTVTTVQQLGLAGVTDDEVSIAADESTVRRGDARPESQPASPPLPVRPPRLVAMRRARSCRTARVLAQRSRRHVSASKPVLITSECRSTADGDPRRHVSLDLTTPFVLACVVPVSSAPRPRRRRWWQRPAALRHLAIDVRCP